MDFELRYEIIQRENYNMINISMLSTSNSSKWIVKPELMARKIAVFDNNIQQDGQTSFIRDYFFDMRDPDSIFYKISPKEIYNFSIAYHKEIINGNVILDIIDSGFTYTFPYNNEDIDLYFNYEVDSYLKNVFMQLLPNELLEDIFFKLNIKIKK
jgi:hypothetical protein